MSPQNYIINLGRTFPSVRRFFEHMQPEDFNVDALAEQLGVLSTGERYAMLFLFNVWNPGYAEEKQWHFDAIGALGMWDSRHREAFLTWARHPYFP